MIVRRSTQIGHENRLLTYRRVKSGLWVRVPPPPQRTNFLEKILRC